MAFKRGLHFVEFFSDSSFGDSVVTICGFNGLDANLMGGVSREGGMCGGGH
jgi:hypothetical protein